MANSISNCAFRCAFIVVGSLIVLLVVNLLCAPPTGAVIVDGTRSGPSALKNQSHEDELIDGYNTKQCGLSDPDLNSSVFVNQAREGQFPWLVSIQVNHNNKRVPFCMGSFISDKWILSAAHCFADPRLEQAMGAKRVFITAGSTNAYSNNNLNFTIERIFYHSRFDLRQPIGFDVALIELKERAPLKTKYNGTLPFINTVCLPKEGKEFKPGQAVKLAGWGRSEWKDDFSLPHYLLTTDMILTDGKKCADVFSQIMKKAEKQYHDYNDFICADYHGKRDACQGDSGGPLLEYADNKAVAIGIVSYGYRCAKEGFPGVYERVSALMPWIKSISEDKEEASVEFTVLKRPSK